MILYIVLMLRSARFSNLKIYDWVNSVNLLDL